MPADQPMMPSPARAADRSIALAVRLGVPRRQAPALIAGICATVAVNLRDQGATDLDWIWSVQRRAIARANGVLPQMPDPMSGTGESEETQI